MIRKQLPVRCWFFLGAIVLVSGACSNGLPLSPSAAESGATAASAERVNEAACWGQATRVFARMGEMGEHASGFPTPRLGLRNLARALHAAGTIEDDTMQALGRFVTQELGLSVDACM